MYIHSCGIAHRNLEPNNLLFRSEPEGTSEIMVADSAMSHIMSDSKSSTLTEACGAPSYMTPEILKKKLATERP